MSWMDSWSRPSKHAVTPPPLYLTAGEEVPYCRSCGRVISERRAHNTKPQQEVKYCSARCRNNKPGPLDRRVESVFASLLSGIVPYGLPSELEDKAKQILQEKRKKKVKGDSRIVVECSEVESVVFGHEKDPEKVFGRRKNRAARGVPEKGEWKSVDMEDDGPENELERVDSKTRDVDARESNEYVAGVSILQEEDYGYGGGKVRPPQSKSDVNGSVGGEKGWAERIEETDDMKAKRQEGQKRAEERELVRKAARRGCAFGFRVPEGFVVGDGKAGRHIEEAGVEETRKCEAIMKGSAVESSFAKGEWGIRWRAKY